MPETLAQGSEVSRRFNVTKTIPGIPTRIHQSAQGRHPPAPRKPSTLSSSTCTRLLIGLVEAAFTPVYPRDHPPCSPARACVSPRYVRSVRRTGMFQPGCRMARNFERAFINVASRFRDWKFREAFTRNVSNYWANLLRRDSRRGCANPRRVTRRIWIEFGS